MREIELKPSRRLGLLLSGMAALALAAIFFAAMPWGMQLALGLGAAGLSLRGWRRERPRASLRIAPDGKLQCLDSTAEWCDVEVLGDSFVSIGLIVLRYRMAGRPVRTLTLLPDSADADSLRRLRVLLRWPHRTRSDTSFPGGG